MQWLRVALCVAFVLVLGGCGDERPEAGGPAALKYVPADAEAVLIVPTDLDGEQLQRLDALLEPALREGDEHSVRDIFAGFFSDVDIDFARDVEPLLGSDLVVAMWGGEENPRLLAAIETSDGERAAALGRKLDLDHRVDGDTLLISINGGTATLEPPASGLDQVRNVSDLHLSDVDDAHGAAVARTDFSTWDSDPLGLETVPLGKAVGELDASRDGIDARLRIAIE